MDSEVKIEAKRTFKNPTNARRAVAKSGLGYVKHMIIKTEEGRYFPIFFPKKRDLDTTEIRKKWKIVE